MASVIAREKPRPLSCSPPTTTITWDNGSTPFSPSSTAPRPLDPMIYTSPASPVYTSLTPPQVRREMRSPVPGSHAQMPRSLSPMPRSRSPAPGPHGQMPRSGADSYSHGLASPNHPSPVLLSPYDAAQMGRRSPRRDRSPSPRPISHPVSNTLPRNHTFKPTDDSMLRQRGHGKWNETDLDASYEKKPHHAYDKTEWLRPSVPNSNWRESNLDGPPPSPNPKRDSLPRQHHAPAHHAPAHHAPVHASLPRNARITVPPDMNPSPHSPFHPQPIISRISMPPSPQQAHQRRPIPLSVIMRLQNPHWAASQSARFQGEGDMLMYPQPMPLPREFFREFAQPMRPQQYPPPELRQPAFYGEVLNPGDIEDELERLDLVHHIPVIHESPGTLERLREEEAEREEAERAPAPAPRPLSPTRLQPMVAPEAQEIQEIPDLEEVLRIRAEIPRALKRRGSVDQSQPLKKASHYEPNQYKHLINKLFRRRGGRHKGEQESGTSSSSEEDVSAATPPSPLSTRLSATPVPHDHRNYHSILRRASRERKASGRRARLSPLVLLLDGSLVGELETVQRAVQEMSDPSQPNDEGITALHNAICGGHYTVVDFLVRIGANVSAPDSHGWTPLHCAASCNDRPLCEFLVRNGAAVMAMTHSDGAIASQKCDPYAVGYEECASFLKGVEEAMGLDNSGVLYSLWNYPAQAPDELSFKEGDMVTILQKPEGVGWWWASLCGREGFVPNNYFGLFPKVRPKSLC